MDGNYDENIAENPFFIEFKNEYGNLFQHSIAQSWVICVPRIGSLNTRFYSIEDFCAHILVPSDELPETHYNTLTEKQATVSNKVITLEVTKGLPLQSHILFEETFYTEDYIKYKVWCIETPLEPVMKAENSIGTGYLQSINDCIDLLWTQAAGRQVLDQIEDIVNRFLKNNPSLPLAIAPLRDLVSDVYTQCLQVVLQNRRLREKSKSSKQVLDNIKLGVECYMQHLIYNSVFKAICTSCSYEDSHLNKRIRNLSDLQLKDLDIRKELYHNVPRAKQTLSKLNDYNTVLEKVLCLKKALNGVNKVDKDSCVLLTADDMLPLFVFLVLKSNLPNWYSQLVYMKEFRFSGAGRGDGDESAFLITTLEAVVQHIQSGALSAPSDPEPYYHESDLTLNNVPKERRNSITESISTDTNGGEETLEYVFELIKSSHAEQVRGILERNQNHLKSMQHTEETFNLSLSEDEDETELCHPLCNCLRCRRKVSKSILRTSPTVVSRDGHGLTPLHVASVHGRAAVVDTLLALGAATDAADLSECTPLHHAASRGHQNALLLLLHAGANVNKTNVDRNTPLHLAVNNGHINCVKALIYFAEHSRKRLRINCANESGDTPLHLASKWGYEGIARLLIENGAEPSLQNRANRTAFDYAHNLRIMNVLKSCKPNLFEYIHISNAQIEQLRTKRDIPAKVESVKRDNPVTRTVENLKRIERILRAISFGDVKLACVFMNIDYGAQAQTKPDCHPLCGCHTCRRLAHSTTTDFDVNVYDSNGFTPLHYACRYGLEELCDILVRNGANVNCCNKRGQTPLHLAASSNDPAILRLLLDKGANINALDCARSTAFHEASQLGNVGAAKVLLTYNPDVTILNMQGKSALDIAKQNVHLTIIDLIENYLDDSRESIS